jgi:hypothetical protein
MAKRKAKSKAKRFDKSRPHADPVIFDKKYLERCPGMRGVAETHRPRTDADAQAIADEALALEKDRDGDESGDPRP